MKRFTVLSGGRLLSININAGPRLCPSFTFWPHCVFEFDTPGVMAALSLKSWSLHTRPLTTMHNPSSILPWSRCSSEYSEVEMIREGWKKEEEWKENWKDSPWQSSDHCVLWRSAPCFSRLGYKPEFNLLQWLGSIMCVCVCVCVPQTLPVLSEDLQRFTELPGFPIPKNKNTSDSHLRHQQTLDKLN